MGLIRPMAALPLGGKVELLVVTNLFFLATFFLRSQHGCSFERRHEHCL